MSYSVIPVPGPQEHRALGPAQADALGARAPDGERGRGGGYIYIYIYIYTHTYMYTYTRI